MRSVLTVPAVLLLPGCLLVNHGSQNPTTMAAAVVGVLILYAGLRFLLGRMNAGRETPAVVRFLGGVLAGLAIFLG